MPHVLGIMLWQDLVRRYALGLWITRPIDWFYMLERLYRIDRTSLGIVRPSKVLDVKIEKVDRRWEPQCEFLYRQLSLFGDDVAPLMKIPFKFGYIFECEDHKRPYERMIEDWELSVLFRKELARLGSEREAAESVRKTYLEKMCAKDRDTRFFMRTRFPYNTWLNVGLRSDDPRLYKYWCSESCEEVPVEEELATATVSAAASPPDNLSENAGSNT